MNELHLFAGAGGGILAGQLLGHRCVCAVEWEAYAQAVLVARQNDGTFPPFPVWSDVQTFDGRPWRGVADIVVGGFPCQDISVAGSGTGITGERSGMWAHMARIVGEVRPSLVFVENSPVLTSRGLGTVLGDLAALGYDCRWTVLGAADVGAPHQRDRIWLLAHANSLKYALRRYAKDHAKEVVSRGDFLGGGERDSGAGYQKSTRQSANVADSECRGRKADGQCGDLDAPTSREVLGGHQTSEVIGRGGCEMADSERGGWERVGQNGYLQGSLGLCDGAGENQNPDVPRPSNGWWETEPDVGRVVNGMAHRALRLKCIGNGQVPAVAAAAFNYLLSEI